MTAREQFEAAMSAYCDPAKVEETFYREGDGYESYATLFAWYAWQAARATAEQRDSVIEEWIEETCAAYCIPKPFAIIETLRALKSQQDAAIEAKQAEQSPDTERLDFTESASTTWYPGRAPNGYGVLCYDIKGRHRAETFGATMREAIDAAIESQRSGDGSNADQA